MVRGKRRQTGAWEETYAPDHLSSSILMLFGVHLGEDIVTPPIVTDPTVVPL